MNSLFLDRHKIIVSLIVFFCCGYISNLRAQDLNIVNDTIFVNKVTDVLIQFPAGISSINTEPHNAPYNVKGEQTRLIIIGTLENSKPAILRVSEGGRTHHFWLIFKKDIDFNDTKSLFKDYSTLKKLKDRIDEINSHGDPGSAPSGGTKEPSGAGKSPVVPVSGEDKQYKIYIASAKTYFIQKKYSLAKEAYTQALNLHPGDTLSIHQLDLISRLESPTPPSNPQPTSKNLYLSYIAQGEKSYKDNQLSEAGAFFEEALSIQPGDVLATGYLKIIAEKERKKKEADDFENNYNASIQLANTLLQAGDLEGAKEEYKRAKVYTKKTFPDDQIRLIERRQAAQEAIESSEKLARDLQIKEENQKKEAQEREDNYQKAMRTGDAFFSAKDYDNAKAEYNKALDLFKRADPTNKIIEIDRIKKELLQKETEKRREEEQLELEQKYESAMQGADKYLQAKDYTNAKIMYNRAMSLIDRQLPHDKIKEINKILEDEARAAAEERIRIAREKVIDDRYNAIVKNANTEFEKENYVKAKTLYGQALALKPSDSFAKDRIDIITGISAKIAAETKAKNDSIAYAKDIEKKFKTAMSKGKASFQKGDFLNAKVFYSDATTLKPQDQDAQKQLTTVTSKLDDIAKETELNNNYNRYMALGDSQRIAKLYEDAIISYNEALKSKPSESDPKVKIKFVQYQIADEERIKQLIKQQELEKDYKTHVNLADKAVADHRYEDARSAFNYALKIHPENNYVQERLSRIVRQLEIQAKEDSIKQAALKPLVVPAKKKSKRKKSAVQEETPVVAQEPAKPTAPPPSLQQSPIPYSHDELKKKYPGIDFSTFPAEQPVNNLTTGAKKPASFYEGLAAQSARLNLSSDDQGIKLTVENIKFEETTAYIKVRIRNNSNLDFLAGAMMLTWTKNTGNHVKLYPYDLFPPTLPVIKPTGEAIIIYTFKTYNILDGDTLTFDLADRLKKFKLAVDIPGSVYNNELINLNKQ